jgi:DinB family protein
MSAPGTSLKQALIEELRDYYEQFENIKEDALELSAPLNDDQFNWRPSPRQWSISECLAHLNVADGLDVPAIRDAIDGGRAAGLIGKGPFRYGFLSRTFVRFSEPPVKLKFKAPKVYRPLTDQPKNKVVPAFIAIHDQLLELIAKSNGLDLARIRVGSPFPYVTFSLGQRFALLAAHDRRHLRQGWNVRRQPNFPV